MIVVHAGNRVDEPGRAPARFPAGRVDAVRGRIGQLLDLLEPAGVVTAAAAGADLLLAGAAIDRKVPVHLVLPFDRDCFREESVADRGERWTSAYDLVLSAVEDDRAGSILELDLAPDDAGYRDGNQALIDRAVQLGGSRVLGVAVRAPGGDGTSVTDDFVERAQAADLFLIDIDPSRGGTDGHR